MQSLIEKLNTPSAVIAVLAVILLVNGFLIYQNRSSSHSHSSQGGAASEADGPSNEASNGTSTAEDQGRQSGPPAETTAQPAEETSDADTSEENTSEENGSEEEADDEQNGASESNEGSPDGANSEEAQQNQEDPQEAPNDDSNSEGSNGESSNNEGEDASVAASSTLLAGLGDSVSSCRETDEDEEECIRDFVVEVAPDSRYVGGRIDLADQAEEVNTEVIYFEDSDLAPCEFERAEYDAEGNRYAVILVGEGSFSDARGDQCIPQA